MNAYAITLLITVVQVSSTGQVEPVPVDQAMLVGAERPAWVVDGVPHTVWLLVEESARTPDPDRMKELLLEAEGHARAALVDHEADVGRRFALAVVLGMRANREGRQTRVQAAASLHDQLEVILDIDPDHARARHMMGRLHAGVRRMNRISRWLATNLLGGGTLKKATWEEAERNLSFAETRVPEVPDHHLQLARLYQDTGRPDLAAEEILHVLEIDAGSPMELEARAEALALWSELGS